MILLMIVVLVSILVAVFAMQNSSIVLLNFFLWEFSASLVVVIVSAFGLGVLVAMCFMLYMKAKHYLKDMKLQEDLRKLQTENAKLTEKVNMLQHARMAHDAANDGKAEEKKIAKADSVGE